MGLSLDSLISETKEAALDRQYNFINPQFSKVLRTIGFTANYVKGQGAYLWDDKGDKYLDFLSGFGAFGLGRNHPTVRAFLQDVMNRDLPNLIKMDASHLAGHLAERLLAKGPKTCQKVFFANSGTEVVEAAMKLARAATGREAFLYLDGSYHGLTYGSLSLTGCAHFRTGFGELFPATCLPMGDLNKLEDALRTKRFAAYFFEPIQGKGLRYPTDDYYTKAQALCRKYGTLFVADEIQTGLGRTGKFFCYEHWNLEPDLVLVSKVLSGGFIPVSAVLMPDEVYKKTFSSMERSVVHSTTFSQNDMAMAAGIATLHVIEEEKLVERAAKMGKLIKDKCEALKSKYELLQEIRGKGLMLGFEFGKPKSMSLKMGWKLVHTADKGLFGQMIVIPLLSEHRILTQVAGHQVDIVKILPTFVISEADVEWFVSAFDSVLKEAHKFPGAMWNVGAKLAKAAMGQQFQKPKASAEAQV